MKTFRCDACNQLLFFENTQCLSCGHTLGYLPDEHVLSALEPTPDGDNRWQALAAGKHLYKMCHNYQQKNVCNWMLPADDELELCEACRLNKTIPNLAQPEHQLLWARLETAKRRLVYTLLRLGLPLTPKGEDAERGLAFDFLAEEQAGEPVITGHANGLVTLNISEADDAIRERNRQNLGEAYRTLLGHFRHEVGHYYWDRLVADSGRHKEFRRLFGDERQDYAAALKRHYQRGAPADWTQNYISPYASAHPWEDWAETWAHYLHMVDTLETAEDFNLTVKTPKRDDRVVEPEPVAPGQWGFDDMIQDWLALTYAINSLNRSMGLADLYPFLLAPAVVDKLRFMHRLIGEAVG